MDFYKRLNYSFGNEDWNVEAQALQVASGDRVACVTASGDRALHLLMTDCAEIISIDMNPAQTYLLELKLAAISQFDYEAYLAFLGCGNTGQRFSQYQQLKPHLSAEAVQYWDLNQYMIAQGVIYQGKTERFTRLAAKFAHLLRRKKIDALFEFQNIEEQKEFIEKKWDTYGWRAIFETLLNPALIKYILNDPGLNGFTEYTDKPGRYIYQRMLRFLNNNPARKSALLQLFLLGKVTPEAYFPYLTYDGYKKIRRDMGRLLFQTNNMVEFLNFQQPNTFDCFSMSDVASYMPQAIFERMLYGIHNSAKPGARFCIREFMSKRFIPADLKSRFSRNIYLEQKLEREESNFVYRFMAGEIQK